MESTLFKSAAELAELIRSGQVTVQKVVKDHLEQIKRHNPILNAIVILMEEQAIQRSIDADEALKKGEIWGPLHGVPVTLKESFNVKGQKTTSNFPPFNNYIAEENSLVAERLEKAGAIIIGKTNVPVFLGDYQSFGPVYGRSLNPYHVEHTPGGSTGGGAAAVSAGFSALEVGSDAGGSVRVPAHYCGLYGMKPTENVISMDGHCPPFPWEDSGLKHLVDVGFLTRDPEDLKIIFDTIKGADHKYGKSTSIDWKVPENKDLKDYKLAWTDQFGNFRADKDTRSLIEKFVNRVSEQKTEIEKKVPEGIDFNLLFEYWANLYGYYIGQFMRPKIRFRSWLHWKFSYGGIGGKGIAKGLKTNFMHYANIMKRKEQAIYAFQKFFQTNDFLICPTGMKPAIRHIATGSDIEVDGKNVEYLAVCGLFSSVFNFTGHPAITIPLGQSGAGLPIGIQIIGPYWSEPELILFAKKIKNLVQGFKAPEGYSP